MVNVPITGVAVACMILLTAVPALAAPTRAEEPGGIRTQSTDSNVVVMDGDRPVLEYVCGKELFKPYVKQFLSPNGVNFLRDNVADHIHHHGLMFAVGIDGVDFWSETKTSGREVHRSFEAATAGAVAGERKVAGLAEHLDWAAPGQDKPLAGEIRSITVHTGSVGGTPLGATLLTWRSVLQPAEGRASVKLSGSHYFGLGMRFLKSMDGASDFFTSKGKVDGNVVRGDERLTPGAWCAYAAEADSKCVTVAMFDSPGNPRPVLWFTMAKPFAYLSATVNLYREPLVIEADKPLTLRYGVAVWDGKVGADVIEKLYRRWLELEPQKAEPTTKPGKS